MVVVLMPVFVLEPLNSITEIHRPAKAGFGYQLQCSCDRRITDIFVLFPDDIKQLLCTEMPLLSQKDAYNFIPLFGLS
jgi:hypothetical protein